MSGNRLEIPFLFPALLQRDCWGCLLSPPPAQLRPVQPSPRQPSLASPAQPRPAQPFLLPLLTDQPECGWKTQLEMFGLAVRGVPPVSGRRLDYNCREGWSLRWPWEAQEALGCFASSPAFWVDSVAPEGVPSGPLHSVLCTGVASAGLPEAFDLLSGAPAVPAPLPRHLLGLS